MEILINLNKLFSKSRIDCIIARKNENNLDINFRSMKILTLLNENLDLVLVLFYDLNREYTYFAVYNPSSEIIAKEKIFPKTKPCSKQKLSDDLGFTKRLALYNYELDLLNSFKIQDALIGADTYYIYTSQWRSNNGINFLDWNLKYEKKIYIQNQDVTKPFYFDTSSLLTVSCCPGHDAVANCSYFKKMRDFFILKRLTDIYIYDLDGNLKTRKQLQNETFLTCSGNVNQLMVMLDSNTSIVTESCDGTQLHFYDLDGTLVDTSYCDINKIHNKYRYHHIEFTANDNVVFLILNSSPLFNYCSIS